MNFYNLALGIANGSAEGLMVCKLQFAGSKKVYLFSGRSQPSLRMIIPDAKKDEWYSITDKNPHDRPNNYMTFGADNYLNIAKFFDNLSRCQTIADLILATSGHVENVSIFKNSLEIIRLRATVLKLKNKFKRYVLKETERVIHLCKEFLTVKNGGILSKSPFLPLDADGMIMPSIRASHFNDEDLLEWALSLSSEQKEKVLFFDFNHYPELTAEIPFKIKQIFPNLSFACFGALPDSMCDVTLIGDSELEEVEREDIQEKEGKEKEKEKGKEKEIRVEETGEYYFPVGHKRKSSSSLQSPCNPKKLKPSSGEIDSKEAKNKEKGLDSEEKSKEKHPSRGHGVKVNRRLLASSSEFFNQLFYGGFNEETQKEIVLKDVHPHILELCLDAFFLRTDLEGRRLETLFEIYKTAFYLGLPSAKALAEAQIIRQLESSPEGLFSAKNERGKEENSGAEIEMTAEEIIQNLGQYYLDLSHIFSMEPKSLLKRAIIKFLKNNLLSINSASYKELFLRFLEADLPLVEIIKKLKVGGSPFANDLDNLYAALWQASLELQGRSLKEILSLCRKYWEKEVYDFRLRSLGEHIKCVEVCLAMDSPVEIKRILFTSLLKAAQVGDGLKRLRPLIGRKGGRQISDKFLEAVTRLMKSIKGDFEAPPINTNVKSVFSLRLMELSRMAFEPAELQIRAEFASIASKVDETNSDAKLISLVLKNRKWEIKKNVDGWDRVVQPGNVISLLEFISPPQVAAIGTLDSYESWGKETKNTTALSLCSVLYYYQEVQNWDKIFETSYLALKYDPNNELALSLYGASLIQYAKVRPDQKEELLSQAKENLDQSIKFNPKNTIAITYLANWHLANEEYKQAKEMFNRMKHQTITSDNLELVNLLLLGTPEEMETGVKILRRTLATRRNQTMDLNWFHLMATHALEKKDKNLLMKFKKFFERCLDAKTYAANTLSLLNRIYKEEALIGPIEEEKKKKLIEAMNNEGRGVDTPRFYQTVVPPTRHPADSIQEVKDSMLQIFELGGESADLPDFDLDAYLLSIEDN